MSRAFALLALLASLPAAQVGLQGAHRPISAARPKVLIIGIDGCRPDSLVAASTPNMDALALDGIHFDQGQAVQPTSSGPNWTSILTGVTPAKHGVVDNSFSGAQLGQYPHFFALAKQVNPGFTLESISSWLPIATNIVSAADLNLGGLGDALVANLATRRILEVGPDALFVHLDAVDAAGHASGFSPSNPAYLAAISLADSQVGVMTAALAQRAAQIAPALEDWLVIVTTDHGGIGTSHGGSSPEETTVFVTLSGPSVPSHASLDAFVPHDVAPTALDHLEVPLDTAWQLDGASLVQPFECAGAFAAVPRHEAGHVELSWVPGLSAQIQGYLLYRDGLAIAFVGPFEFKYIDTPDMGGMSGHPLFQYELQTVISPGAGTCAPLYAETPLSAGSVFLEDDFDSYADDAAFLAAGWLPVDNAAAIEAATWTVETQPVCPGYLPAGMTNPPTYDGSPSRGGFVISDSCKGGLTTPNILGGGASHDLVSPRIDCSLQPYVWLHVDVGAQINNNGDALFLVDASRDDGQTWTNMLTRISPGRPVAPFPDTTNADGYFGRLTLDLTSVCSGWDQCRVRFRQFEPTWDWWCAIDNVLVDSEDTTQGGPLTLLPLETFSGPAFPPLLWQIVGLNTGTETWHDSDKGGKFVPGAVSHKGINRIGQPGPTPDFALLDSDGDPDPVEDEYLITPPLDCTGAARVFLHWKSEVLRFSTAQHEAVLVSLDGGQTYLPDPVFTYDTNALHDKNEEPWYAERVLEVPEAAGEPNVAFAFHFSSDGDEYWWAVDDVAVTAAPTGP